MKTISGNEFALAIQSGYEQGYKDSAIKELEKIKKEINLYVSEIELEGEVYYRKETIDNLLEQHIKENLA